MWDEWFDKKMSKIISNVVNGERFVAMFFKVGDHLLPVGVHENKSIFGTFAEELIWLDNELSVGEPRMLLGKILEIGIGGDKDCLPGYVNSWVRELELCDDNSFCIKLSNFTAGHEIKMDELPFYSFWKKSQGSGSWFEEIWFGCKVFLHFIHN